MFWEGHLGCEFHRVQGPLKHHVRSFCASVHTVIAIHMSTKLEVYFVAELNITKEVRVLFNLILEPLTHQWTFFPCQLVWVYAWSEFCVGTAEDSSLTSLQRCTWKTIFLRNFCGGTLSDSLRKNISLHPYCSDILQSTFSQICDILLSC